jgi:hypothetical protein
MLRQLALPIDGDEGDPLAPIIIFDASDQPYDWKTRNEWHEIGYKVELALAQTRIPKAYIRKGTCKVELWDMDQVDIIQTDEAYVKRLRWLDWVDRTQPWNRFNDPAPADGEA